MPKSSFLKTLCFDSFLFVVNDPRVGALICINCTQWFMLGSQFFLMSSMRVGSDIEGTAPTSCYVCYRHQRLRGPWKHKMKILKHCSLTVHTRQFSPKEYFLIHIFFMSFLCLVKEPKHSTLLQQVPDSQVKLSQIGVTTAIHSAPLGSNDI